MAMKLLDLYKSMMATAGLIVTEDNLVACRLTEESVVPVMLKGQRLALPSREILARPDKSDIVVFHPLMEQIHKGESEILEKYRKLLMLRFNEVAGTMMLKLLNISLNVAEQSQLTPDQAEFLTQVKGVDETTVKTFLKVLEAMPSDQTARRIVTLFMKKTGTVAGKRYKRVGVVSFPLYDELHKAPVITVVPAAKKGEKDTKKTDYDIYGVKCRAKDREVLVALLEYIFPNIQEVGSYNRGSDSDVAANLDAMMQAALAIISALNSVAETFESEFNKNEDARSLYIDCDWQETFLNLGSMMNEIRMVPMQAGNEGASEEANKPNLPQTTQSAAYPSAAQLQPTSAVVVPAHQPSAAPTIVSTQAAAPVKSGQPTGQPLDSYLAQREQERNHQRALEQGWQQVTHQPPQQQQQQPMYNPAAAFVPQQQMAYMPPPVPPVVNTGRGLDFASVIAHNPAVLYATGGPVNPGMYPQQQPAPQTSRFFQNWNAPQAPQYMPGMTAPGYAPAAPGYYPAQAQPVYQQGGYPQGYQRTV